MLLQTKKRRFIVRCPKCHLKQQVEIEGYPIGYFRKCSFCGKNFCIHKNPQNSNLVKEVKDGV
jgi:hypothetical protein